MAAFADVGCGFGGLTVRLAEAFPDKLVLAMELRDKVSEYVKERILALRKQHPGRYQNAACVRTNSMKYLTHYFNKGQLEKLFFLFPVSSAGWVLVLAVWVLMAGWWHCQACSGAIRWLCDLCASE